MSRERGERDVAVCKTALLLTLVANGGRRQSEVDRRNRRVLCGFTVAALLGPCHFEGRLRRLAAMAVPLRLLSAWPPTRW